MTENLYKYKGPSISRKRLAELREEMLEQDNMATESPIYVVFEERRGKPHDKISGVFLTLSAAKRHIEQKGYKLTRPYTYCDWVHDFDLRGVLRGIVDGSLRAAEQESDKQRSAITDARILQKIRDLVMVDYADSMRSVQSGLDEHPYSYPNPDHNIHRQRLLLTRLKKNRDYVRTWIDRLMGCEDCPTKLDSEEAEADAANNIDVTQLSGFRWAKGMRVKVFSDGELYRSYWADDYHAELLNEHHEDPAEYRVDLKDPGSGVLLLKQFEVWADGRLDYASFDCHGWIVEVLHSVTGESGKFASKSLGVAVAKAWQWFAKVEEVRELRSAFHESPLFGGELTVKSEETRR